jgi:aryl-alcohol dehydrogenase-like predicted oxidoreductase
MIKKIMLGGNILSYALNYKESNNLLALSHEVGVRSIDTANVYSDGESEKIIGKSLQDIRDKWFIASKNGLRTGEKINRLNSKEKIQENLEKSLIRLKTDYIDLYQLHHFDETVPIDESFEVLESLKSAGKILHYGVSNFKPTHFNFNMANFNVSTNQIHFNIVNRDAEYIYEDLLKNNKIKLIAYNVLARGLFKKEFIDNANPKSYRFNKSKSVYEDLNPKMIKILKILNKYSQKYGISIADLAARYVLEKPFVSHVILGVRTQFQLTQFSKKLSKNIEIDWPQIIKELYNEEENTNLNLGSFNFYSN